MNYRNYGNFRNFIIRGVATEFFRRHRNFGRGRPRVWPNYVQWRRGTGARRLNRLLGECLSAHQRILACRRWYQRHRQGVAGAAPPAGP